jgi:hypothetical protein
MKILAVFEALGYICLREETFGAIQQRLTLSDDIWPNAMAPNARSLTLQIDLATASRCLDVSTFLPAIDSPLRR